MSKHGKRKEGDLRRRENGRPAVVADMLVGLRLPIETRQAVLEWAKGQPDQPNLSEAIRSLIDVGLLRTAETTATGNVPSVGPSKPVQADEGGRGGQPEPIVSSHVETGSQDSKVDVERTARAVGWTPRVVETTPRHAPKSLALISALPPASPRPQPAIPNVYDNKPYQMPEDVKAFNEYWMLVEHRLGRRLAYEEAVVLFNQEGPASNYFIED
jgi:hypothetical protein